MNLRFLTLVATIYWWYPATGFAVVVDNWGTVVTDVDNVSTFSFAQYNITDNFTHDYLFSLEGTAGATYQVTFDLGDCKSGCGNPDLSWGIYDASGGLYTSSSSTVTLAAGNYSFQVMGTGMGSGNSYDYWGNVTITTTVVKAEALVAPVPEPGTFALFALGGGLFGLFSHRWRKRLPEFQRQDATREWI